MSVLFDVLTRFRVVIVMFVCIPASFLWDTLAYFRNRIVWAFFTTKELHDQRVRDIQAQILQWRKDGAKKMLCTGRASWATMSIRVADFKKECNRIMINLPDILEINTTAPRPYVRTEPGVNMGYMTHFLIPKGYALKCQVEMEDLTIGGLCCGLGMETTSHKYGLMQETILAVELVLADGSFIRCTKDENADLFRAFPWSHGSLGFLVAVEVEIMPIKPFIHMTYIPCHSREEYSTRMKEMSTMDNPPEFLEATIYSKETAVIQAGELVDVKDVPWNKVNHINYFWKPYYFKWVESFLDKGQADEYIPLREFYHRFTRSIFWELENLIPFCNHPLYRIFWGWMGPPKISMLKYTMTPDIRRETMTKHVVQDIIIPIEEMATSVAKFHDWFNIYPLLVFPIRIWKHEGDFLDRLRVAQKEGESEMYFDLGVYGVPQCVKDGKPFDAIRILREMEAYTRDVAGYQCPYADLFCTRAEFRQMFNHTLYDRVRKKYGAAGAFPEVFDKVKPEKWVSEEIGLLEGS